jgi:uncharacterized protein (TIGR00369 family)
LRFEREGENGARSEIVLAEHFQGWRGVAHGGIVAALLDEAMAHAAGMRGYRGVTAELCARFKKPVPLSAPIVIRGRVEAMRRTVMDVTAEVVTLDGDVLATAEGKFIAKGTVEPGRLGAGAFE